jgi:hypothetical protein
MALVKWGPGCSNPVAASLGFCHHDPGTCPSNPEPFNQEELLEIKEVCKKYASMECGLEKMMCAYHKKMDEYDACRPQEEKDKYYRFITKFGMSLHMLMTIDM